MACGIGACLACVCQTTERTATAMSTISGSAKTVRYSCQEVEYHEYER